MDTLTTGMRGSALRLLAATVIAGGLHSIAAAQDGTWTSDQNGDYFTAGNWQGNQVAQGAGNTANFNTVDIDTDVAVGLDGPLTIGHFIFGDANLGSPGTWEFFPTVPATSRVTLDAGAETPTITVNELTPTAFDDIFFTASLLGSNGFTKLGQGNLQLNGTMNTITGTVNVNEGTLRLGPALAYVNDATPETPINQTLAGFMLADGTTLETAAPGAGFVNNVTVAQGATATLRWTGTGSGNAQNVTAAGGALPGGDFNSDGTVDAADYTSWRDMGGTADQFNQWRTNFGAMGGSSGSTLNVAILNNQTLSAGGNWEGFDAINVTGESEEGISFFRLMPNPTGGPAGFNAASFANTKVHLDNAQMSGRTNSQGNDFQIGELSGTSTGALAGGASGSAARYVVGGLGTDSEFAGTVNGAGGLSINKVGAGTLTLSGEFMNSPALVGPPGARQGGVFRVSEGTLAITGATSIPGGTGTTLTTIDVLPGTVFDVSGAPGTFATSALQKIQGNGTVLGNYNHAAGNINSGDVGAPTAENEGNLSSAVTPTAGSITFDGDLTLGGGNIVYDMSLNPASGNDLIQVTGQTALSSGTITPNFLAGDPAVGLTYTVLESAGGFSGSPGNIQVLWPGRGNAPTVTTSGNLLQFTTTAILPPAQLVWRGTPGTTWDVQTSQNWSNGGNPDVFFQDDEVTFDGTASNFNVTINSSVRPASIVVDSSQNYSFTGTGGIVGATSLTKRGSGTLTLQTPNNTFSGGTTIEGGTIDIGGVNSAMGTGVLTLNGGIVLFANTAPQGFTNSSTNVLGTGNVIEVAGNTDSGAAFEIGSLTGDGELTIRSPVAGKWFGSTQTGTFSGELTIEPVGGVALGSYRLRAGQTNFPNAVVNLSGVTVANQQGFANDAIATVEFGELQADSTVQLNAFIGGSSQPMVHNWQIGNLNTDSSFEGTVIDGSFAVSAVTKVGAGSLTMGGFGNTYTGDTSVLDGVLRTTHNTVLPEATDVRLTTGGILHLDFAGTNTVNALFFDDVAQAPGNYSAATHPAFFMGSGQLSVTMMGAAAASLAAVPEPSALLLAGFAMAGGLAMGRRRRMNGC